jgi:hypothetical protein
MSIIVELAPVKTWCDVVRSIECIVILQVTVSELATLYPIIFRPLTYSQLVPLSMLVPFHLV